MEQIVRIEVKLTKRKLALMYAVLLVSKAVDLIENRIIKSSIEVVPIETEESASKS